RLLLYLCWIGADVAAQPNVSAALDSNRILIGDQVRLNIYVEHSKQESILGVDYSELEKIENIEILATAPWDTLSSGEQFVLQQRLTLTAFDSGYYRIPPLPVQYIKADGQAAAVMTNDLALAVDRVFMPGDSLELAPIKPIIEEPLKFSDFIPYLGIGLGVIALAALVYFFFWRRRQEGEKPAVPAVIRPAHEVALEKLSDLKSRKLWQQGEVKAYHSELTYILREYIERRYDAPALESTTSEIMRSLQLKAIDEDLYNRLRSLLQLADLVKFAKAEPAPDRHDQAMIEAVYFVEQTKWIPIQEEEQEEEKTEPAEPQEEQPEDKD
ncbi:MAG: hypothetical protein KJT03_23450, partial [Verrucomicrobiae bacterium]|nr:hypothetical protein [Verrucomicrobiae bacterium]